jgi:DNA-binding MarR family transcriptional regulator
MKDGIVQRASRGRIEAERDREMLEWIARFRFVTAEVLAERFALTPQRVNARLRQLEHTGLIEREASGLTQSRAVFVTGRGARRLGLRVRRAPRPDAQREHELAIARLVAQLERPTQTAATQTILTEREQRAAEADGAGRFSVALRPNRSGELRRWPDIVLETDAGHRTAIELELTMKAPERLKRIVAGYATTPLYADVRFMAAHPRLAVRLAALIDRRPTHRPLAAMLDLTVANLTVEPWPGAPTPVRQRITEQLAARARPGV